MSIDIEVKESYYLITPNELNSENLDTLDILVNKKLMESGKNIVLSFAKVETIFSIHLSNIIKLFKKLKNLNLKLILTDISLPVLNVLQMTKMETLLPIYITFDDFKASKEELLTSSKENGLRFEYRIANANGAVQISLEGFLVNNRLFKDMLKQIAGDSLLHLDFNKLAFAEWDTLEVLVEMTKTRRIAIGGASPLVIEFLEDKGIAEKFVLEGY
jgi:anti-anti-sigma factor